MQIVIAWVEESQEIVKVGRVDLGESHKFKSVRLPKSCMWLNRGTESDVMKAKAYAAKENRTVFCYDGANDPLECARRDVQKMDDLDVLKSVNEYLKESKQAALNAVTSAEVEIQALRSREQKLLATLSEYSTDRD